METRQKTGGRKKGTPNRLTYQTRALLLQALANEIENLPETLAALEPHDRLEVLIKLMPYIVPKMQPVSPTVADQKGLRDCSEVVSEMETENIINTKMQEMLRL